MQSSEVLGSRGSLETQIKDENIMHDLFTILVVAVLFFILTYIYFLPSIFAFKRQHPNRIAIFILNFFLGCTLVGWGVALYWALNGADSK